jgi:two-component system response regulator DevR
MNPVSIVIADDHAVVRMGLKALLSQQVDLHVVGEASTGEEAIQQATLHRPDLVIMDIRMPGLSGIDACRKITKQLPDTRVILLTSYAEDELLFAAIRAGAVGYVLKRLGTTDLIHAIREVVRGEAVLDPIVTEAMFKRISQLDKDKDGTAFSALSNQELRVLAMIRDGASNRDIAGRLFLGEGTIRNYVSNVLSKLHVANRAAAAAFAVQHKVEDHVTFD